MYGDGELRAHIEIAWEIFEALEIGDSYNPGVSYRSSGVSQVKNLTYKEEYLKCLQDGLWTMLLSDKSIVQFDFDSRNSSSHLRYAYYDNPFFVMPFKDFVSAKRVIFDVPDLPDEAFESDYAIYLDDPDQWEAREHVTPIRYDYAPKEYTPGCHPASHVHFGHRSSVRIATGRLLKPSSFACLIARQCYPTAWQDYRKSAEENLSKYCKHVHANLDSVPTRFFNLHDFEEMGLDLSRMAARVPPKAQGKRRGAS